MCSSLILIFSAFSRSHHAVNTTSPVNSIRDTIPEKDSVDETRVFDKVDIEASFRGGDKAWLKFLESNLDGSVATKKKAPEGYYTVLIQFVVDKEGSITDIRPLTNHGYGMEEEVIRLLKIAPHWKPAIQNGRPVKAYRRQPVTFVVEERKKRRN